MYIFFILSLNFFAMLNKLNLFISMLNIYYIYFLSLSFFVAETKNEHLVLSKLSHIYF